MIVDEPALGDKQTDTTPKEYTGQYGLLRDEIEWRRRYPFLLRRGYGLRPRFRSGWVPSWLGTDVIPAAFEDFDPLPHPRTIDAVWSQVDYPVCIKTVKLHSEEVRIALHLNSPELRDDPMNHCVPVLDVFSDEINPDMALLVMPNLRRFDSPPFYAVSEVVDFIRQTLEGLVFMHGHNVAHRDCSNLNIMLFGNNLYPEGFHPAIQNWKPSGRGTAKALRRIDVPSVRYYFTDFGISTQFKDGDTNRLVCGLDGQDRDVPELSEYEPYDPFLVDVFILGNVYRNTFTNVYNNLTFLDPLVAAMTARVPTDRPSAEEALSLLEYLVSQQSSYAFRWRLCPRKTWTRKCMMANLSSLVAESSRITKESSKRPLSLFLILAAVTVSALTVERRNREMIRWLCDVIRSR